MHTAVLKHDKLINASQTQHVFLTNSYKFQFYEQNIMRLYKQIRFSVQIAHSKLQV